MTKQLEKNLREIAQQHPHISQPFKETIMSTIPVSPQETPPANKPSNWLLNWRLYAGVVAAGFVIFSVASIGESLLNRRSSLTENLFDSAEEIGVVTSTNSGTSSSYDWAEDNYLSAPSREIATETASGYANEQGEMISGSIDNLSPSSILYPNQKVIKNATYLLASDSPASSAQFLIDLTNHQYRGYIQDSSINKSENKLTGKTYETAHLIARIPSENFEAFRSELTSLEDVQIKTERLAGDDITSQYVDIEARRKNLQSEEEQLQVLLQRTENIQDILQVRSQLSYIRGQIEQLTAQLKNFDSAVDYSTFSITIEQTKTSDDDKPKNEWSLKEVIQDAWDNLIADYQTLVEDIITISFQSLILIPLLGILIVVVVILRILFRKRT